MPVVEIIERIINIASPCAGVRSAIEKLRASLPNFQMGKPVSSGGSASPAIGRCTARMLQPGHKRSQEIACRPRRRRPGPPSSSRASISACVRSQMGTASASRANPAGVSVIRRLRLSPGLAVTATRPRRSSGFSAAVSRTGTSVLTPAPQNCGSRAMAQPVRTAAASEAWLLERKATRRASPVVFAAGYAPMMPANINENRPNRRLLPNTQSDRLRGRGPSRSRAAAIGAVTSNIDLFRNGDGIIYFDAKVADCAFKLRVSQQKLNGAKISSLPVNQGCLGPAKRMRAEAQRIEADAADPAGSEPGILPRRHMLLRSAGRRARKVYTASALGQLPGYEQSRNRVHRSRW